MPKLAREVPDEAAERSAFVAMYQGAPIGTRPALIALSRALVCAKSADWIPSDRPTINPAMIVKCMLSHYAE